MSPRAPTQGDTGAPSATDAAVAAWHAEAERAGEPEPLAALSTVFQDFDGVRTRPAGPGDTERRPSLAEDDTVGLQGDEAEEFLAICAAAARSERRDWLPMVVVAVLVGLFLVGSTGILQSAWQHVREAEIARRMSRPRAGKSWTEHTGAKPADLGLKPAPAGIKRRRNPFVLAW